MSLRSAAARVLGHFGGRSRSLAKVEAAKKNLPVTRRYNLSTPASMLDSLDVEDRVALAKFFKGVRASAVPFNNGNTNWLGQLPCLQILIARKKLARFGLPDEVEGRAAQFVEQFIHEGMGDPNPDALVAIPQEIFHAS